MASYSSYCENYVKEILSKLKLAMKHYNIDQMDGFKKLDKDGNYFLTEQEFGVCLKQIDPTITAYEINLAFNQLDVDKQGKVNYGKFYALLEKVELPKGIYQTQDQLQQEQKDNSQVKLEKLLAEEQNIKSKGELAINKLKQAIVYYKINVEDLFKKYDTQTDSNLDVNEFTNLIVQIEPNLQVMDILTAFSIFDKDRNYSINLKEFVDVLQI